MKKLLLLYLVVCSFSSLAQNSSEPQKIIDEFFKLYKNKSSDAALDYIFSTNKWMDTAKEQIEGVKFKLNSSVVRSMGEYHGYRLITTKTVGDDLILYSYLIKYDMKPIRFNFFFYKINDGWRLQSFSYDDTIKEELEEGIKVYRLKENANH